MLKNMNLDKHESTARQRASQTKQEVLKRNVRLEPSDMATYY